MLESQPSRSLMKRLLLVTASVIGIVLVCVFAAQLSVQQMFRGIASSRATGLAHGRAPVLACWLKENCFGSAVSRGFAVMFPSFVHC